MFDAADTGSGRPQAADSFLAKNGLSYSNSVHGGGSGGELRTNISCKNLVIKDGPSSPDKYFTARVAELLAGIKAVEQDVVIYNNPG